MLLKPALMEHVSAPPASWSHLAQGEWLKAQTQQQLDTVLPRCFGYHLVTYGALANQLSTKACAIKHRVKVAPQQADVLASAHHWPFAEASVDAVLIANVLEYNSDPHLILRELTRSLIADGHLVIFGMNPFSPAIVPGLWYRGRHAYPWCGRYFSQARVLDWLALLNFEITSSCIYAPSMLLPNRDQPSVGAQRLFANTPRLGSMYMICARKREYPLTPIKLKQKKRSPVGALNLANYQKPS